jgi:hypothetical protein
MCIPYGRVQGSGYNACTGKYCIICQGGTKKNNNKKILMQLWLWVKFLMQLRLLSYNIAVQLFENKKKLTYVSVGTTYFAL